MVADSDRKALLKNALVALEEMQAKLDAAEAAQRQPIAVIGMACRFPGGSSSPEQYWETIRAGKDAVGPVPEGRWLSDAIQEADIYPAVPFETWQGGFVEGLDLFEPQFFGITPREAITMDPQQRILMELAWEALERAGIPPDSLSGSRTGVSIGISTNDYYYAIRDSGHDPLDAYAATGTSLNVAAGRLSFTLGLQGPSMAVDTACSSSLTALHVACNSLRKGESNLFITGGVNGMLVPYSFPIMYKWGMLSPDGRCKVFDADANGFVRAEGGGLIILKRLADAQADGDNILAVIRGTAVNQDGRSTGLTAPNGRAQQLVLRTALADAGVQPHEISYIEAHGTGTPLGDPIEVEALGAVMGEGRNFPLILGSVKSIIGHAEAASGIASVIKVILSMQHGEVAPNLHLHERSPQIPWPDFPIVIPTEPTPWNPPSGQRRLAGVSAFGFSGTNAHVVLEEAPETVPAENQVERPRHLLTLSARGAKPLRERAQQLVAFLENNPDTVLADVANSLNSGRVAFPYRLAFIAADPAEALAELKAFEADEDDPGLMKHIVQAERPRIAFLFTGQGAQYLNMGRTLYETQPTFRETLDACDTILSEYIPGGLLPVLFGDESQAETLNNTAYTQPALFAVEYALAQLWLSWGITPHAVLGHSVGEFVAACVAGVFSLEDGLRLIAERGRLMGALPAGGVMAAIMADEASVAEWIAPFGDEVVIATLNGPENTVISGSGSAVEAAVEAIAARGVKMRRLRVSHAFHSPLMDPMLAEFERVLQTVTFHKPQLRLAANVTGAFEVEALTQPEYWLKQARGAVRFADGMQTLYDAGYRTFLEVGPNATLISMAQSFLDEAAWLASLREKRDNWDTMLTSLGTLYVQGMPVDWAGFERDYDRRKLVLPTYPFQRQRYWPEVNTHLAAQNKSGHPLLGEGVRSPLHPEIIHQQTISSAWSRMLDDHRIYGLSIVPATGYIDMILSLGQSNGYQPVVIENVEIEQALVVPDEGTQQIQMIVTPNGGNRSQFEVFSPYGSNNGTASTDWKRHVIGDFGPQSAGDQSTAPTLAEVQATYTTPYSLDGFYKKFDDSGLNFGPTFRNLKAAWTGPDDDGALGRIELDPEFKREANKYNLYPGLLDACFHLLDVVLDNAEDDDDINMPIAINRLIGYQSAGVGLWCYARFRPRTHPDLRTADVYLYDDDSRLIAELDGLQIRRTNRSILQRLFQTDYSKWLYEVEWNYSPLEALDQIPTGHWLILADSGGLGAALAAHLEAADVPCDVLLAEDLPADTPAMFADLPDTDYSHIVHMWSLDTPADIEAMKLLSLYSALDLVQTLANRSSPAKIWLVTRQAQPARHGAPAATFQSPLWGLGRVIAQELPGIWGGLLDIDETSQPYQMLSVFLADDDEDQLMLRAGERYVARLHFSEPPQSLSDQAFQLTLTEKGVLENLTLLPVARQEPGPGEVEIRVHATGLNFRDVLNVLGMYPGEGIPLGTECTGKVVRVGPDVAEYGVGDRVLVLGGNAFNSYMTAPVNMVFPVPQNLTMAETGSIPSIFLTAYEGLHRLAGMKAGDRVLIHAAAGGVGLAAVQLAQRAGVEVFATAGSEAKHAYLRSIGVKHVMSSREPGFADEIMRITNGEGVNIVLNSLADDFIPQSLSVLAPGGCFLEIGKRGVWTDAQVQAQFPGLRYYVYDLTELLLSDPDYIPNMLRELLDLFAAGELIPPPIQTFPLESVVDAFRFMARARHIGKLVITQSALPTFSGFAPDATYLVTGGLGGLGLKVAEWMVESGARNVVLVGRRAPSEAAQAVIDNLEAAGARVVAAQTDISDYEQTAVLLDELAQTLPPLRGIIHAAGVLADAALMQQTREGFDRVLAAKVYGAWNLHHLTIDMPLDFFVLFSSGSSVLGAGGQANYAAGNAFLDGLAHDRVARGLPALSINWGPWSEVGMAAALSQQHQERLQSQGIRMIAPDQGLSVLDRALRTPITQVLVIPTDRQSWTTPVSDAPPLVRDLVEAAGLAAPAEETSSESPRERILHADPAERSQLMQDFLRGQVASVVGLSVDALDVALPITSLGIDSLMAVEIRNRLEKGLGLSITVAAILEGPSVMQMVDELQGQFDGSATTEAIAPAMAEAIDWEEGEL